MLPIADALTAWNWIQGTTTLLIAVGGLSIAWRQLRNAEYKTKLDLFDRRYAVYESVFRPVNAYFESGKWPRTFEMVPGYGWFNDPIWKSKFLFDSRVTVAIEDIQGAAGSLLQAYHIMDADHEPLDEEGHRGIMRSREANLRRSEEYMKERLNTFANEVLPYLIFKRVGLDLPFNLRIESAIRHIKNQVEEITKDGRSS